MALGEEPVAVAAASAIVAAAAEEPAGAPRRRRRAGAIDLDSNIQKAKESMKEASKALSKARADARNEKRKKQRLLRKAASLTMLDLGRIAQLKNSGLWDPSHGLPDVPGEVERLAMAPAVVASASSSSAPTTPSAASGSCLPAPRAEERAGGPHRADGEAEGSTEDGSRGVSEDPEGHASE